MRTSSFFGVAVIASVASIASIACVAHADLVSLEATRNATLYQSADGSLANGAGQYCFAGRTNGDLIRRGLLQFDVFSAIPVGATITNARLTLNITQANGGDRVVTVNRAMNSWTTGASDPTGTESSGAPALLNDTTWLYRTANGAGGGLAWDNVGGDYSAFFSASLLTTTTGLQTWSSLGLLNDVRLFAVDPAQNFGWFLLGDESIVGTTRRFDSAYSASFGGIVPRLEIEFTTVPAPSACALLAMTGLTGFIARRKR